MRNANDKREQSKRGCINQNRACQACKSALSEQTIDIHSSYWGHVWLPIHKDCKSAYAVLERYECQKLDADCNDCGFFERLHGNDGGCLKMGTRTVAYPNFAMRRNCFSHRNDHAKSQH